MREAAYSHLISLLPPGRRPVEGGVADGIVRMLGGLEGRLMGEVLALAEEAFPHLAEALDLHAQGRMVQRIPPDEEEASFRARVVGAVQFWHTAGTLPGVLLWLRAAGYQAFIREHYLDDPAIWAEFSVYLWPEVAAYVTDRWNDGVGAWDDGTPWDYQLAATEVIRIPTLLREVKPAHARVRSIWYVSGPRDAWDDGGAWDDGRTWNPEPIQIL